MANLCLGTRTARFLGCSRLFPELGQSRSKPPSFGRRRAEIGQNWTDIGHIWSQFAQTRPKGPGSGQPANLGPSSTNFGKSWPGVRSRPKLGRFGPQMARVRPTLAQFQPCIDQCCSVFGLFVPKLSKVDPNQTDVCRFRPSSGMGAVKSRTRRRLLGCVAHEVSETRA